MVGFAWLDADAPFSMLRGMDRTITLVEGLGFTLDVGGAVLPVLAPFAPTRFDGGVPTTCSIAGPSRVLNVMTRRGGLRHSLAIVDRSGPVQPGAGPASVAVVLAGHATMGAVTLDRLDAVCLDEAGAIGLSEGGALAVITIEPV